MLVPKKLAVLNETKQTGATDSITVTQNVDIFLKSFVKMYTEHPDYRQSFLVLLMKGALAKMHGHRNPQYPSKVFNFFRVLECTSRSAFDFASGNLIGPSLRSTMQRRNAADRKPPYIYCDMKIF